MSERYGAVRMRDGLPICFNCDEPMVQVEEPTAEFPGGLWQCSIGQAEIDLLRSAIGRAADRILGPAPGG